MTSAIAKYAAQKMLSKEMDKYKSKRPGGAYDPYYEMIPHPRKPGKQKKVKKQIPSYIPEHDAKVLAQARKSAYRLDYALFNFLGIRFGWSSVIGLVPAIGDFGDLVLALLLILSMCKVDGGLPAVVLARMGFNMLLDFGVGLVPVLGDLADATYKCNGRNVRLLEKHLDARYKPQELKEQDKALAAKGKRVSMPATVYEDFSDEEEERRATFDDRHADVRQPQRAYSGRKERIADEEMGMPRQPRRDDTRRDDTRRDDTRRGDTRRDDTRRTRR